MIYFLFLIFSISIETPDAELIENNKNMKTTLDIVLRQEGFAIKALRLESSTLNVDLEHSKNQAKRLSADPTIRSKELKAHLKNADARFEKLEMMRDNARSLGILKILDKIGFEQARLVIEQARGLDIRRTKKRLKRMYKNQYIKLAAPDAQKMAKFLKSSLLEQYKIVNDLQLKLNANNNSKLGKAKPANNLSKSWLGIRPKSNQLSVQPAKAPTIRSKYHPASWLISAKSYFTSSSDKAGEPARPRGRK